MSEKIDEKTIDNELLLKRKIEKYYELDKYDKEIIENIATSDELTKKVMKHIEEEEKRTNYNISEKNMCEIIKLVGYHYDSMMKIQNAKDKPLNAIKGHNEPNDKITITKVEAKDRKKNKKRNKVSIFGKIKSVFEKKINKSTNKKCRGSLFQRIKNIFVKKDKEEEISIPFREITENEKIDSEYKTIEKLDTQESMKIK